MAEQPADENRFDASQYAFFGGEICQEVELGGLDEEDDTAMTRDIEEDEGISLPLSEKEEIDGLDTNSGLNNPVEIANMSSSFMNLGLGSSSHGPEAHLKVDHNLHRFHGVGDPHVIAPTQGDNVGPRLNEREVPMARTYPTAMPQDSMFQDVWQPGAASRGNLLAGYRSHIPHPPSRPVQAYSAFTPAPHLWQVIPPVNFSHGLSQGLMQQQLTQHLSFPMPPEALTRMQLGRAKFPLVNAQEAFLMPSTACALAQQYPNEHHGMRDIQHLNQQHVVQTPQPRQQVNGSSSQQRSRSKHMTLEELESIARIQRAASHSTDPYIDDYYHQAVRAKAAGVMSFGRKHFAPHQLRNTSSHRRASLMQPSFVPVDGLGKVPFSSFRSPRPLLEVHDSSIQTAASGNLKQSQLPLEQEPMLAARIAIEDGLCLLLDVDDIDRYLTASQFPDGGIHLRMRRQTILEELAASLQLFDPSNPRENDLRVPTETNGKLTKAEAKDLVFLHLASLPKGLKLLSRYLELLPEGSQLVQRACVPIFQHLHALYGVSSEDSDAAAATSLLARSVARRVGRMDLISLTACVAALVSSLCGQPCLRLFGSGSGDGSSLIVGSSLDRATSLLTDRSLKFSLQERKNWQAVFDSFFQMLYKHCTLTFDRILDSMAMSSASGIEESAAERMSKELPIGLLRASLPHMNEQQRSTLLDFTQRSIAEGPTGGQNTSRESHAGSTVEKVLG